MWHKNVKNKIKILFITLFIPLDDIIQFIYDNGEKKKFNGFLFFISATKAFSSDITINTIKKII